MRRTTLAAIVSMSAVLLSGGVAHGAANPGASCLGVGSSANAGFPGDRALISHDVKVLAATAGVTPGRLISDAARQHLGTPAACFGD